jgi:predicted GIY-YIG superfamily endonuclease
LEKNLDALDRQYHVKEAIKEDKHKIIEDANRNLKGFANCKHNIT